VANSPKPALIRRQETGMICGTGADNEDILNSQTAGPMPAHLRRPTASSSPGTPDD
jgi:hypothetical protein